MLSHTVSAISSETSGDIFALFIKFLIADITVDRLLPRSFSKRSKFAMRKSVSSSSVKDLAPKLELLILCCRFGIYISASFNTSESALVVFMTLRASRKPIKSVLCGVDDRLSC